MKVPNQDHSENGNFTRLVQKRIYCQEHGNKLIYKCGYQYCANPILCDSMTCIQSHFHHQNQGKLILTKFDSSEYSKKFVQLDRIFNKEDFSGEAKQLKSFIDEMKSSMVSIYKDYKELHTRKDQLTQELNKPFQLASLEKIQETINLGHNLRKSLNLLKSKVNFNIGASESLVAQRDENGQNGSKQLPCGNQSPARSHRQQKVIQPENLDKLSGRGSQKQHQQNQHNNDKNYKENNEVIPIDLERSSEQSFKRKQDLIVQSKPSIAQQKNLKIPSTKDSFQALFDNNGSKVKPKQNAQLVQSLTPQKIASFKSMLQNIPVNDNNNSPFNQNILSHKNGHLQNQINPSQTNQKINLDSKNQSLKIYERDFFMKKQLTIFLEQRITNFTWGLCEQVYNTFMTFKTPDKFHQLLEGRRNLLFVFIGQNRILGSYYPSRYPRLVEKLRNDPASFLYISNNQQTKILQYKAVPGEFHLAISDKLHICHGNTPSYADGIRTTQRNFSQLNYYLPSFTYKEVYDENEIMREAKTLSGFVKVKEFYVLQLNGVEPSAIELN